MQVSDLIAECHRIAMEKGWWDRDREIPEQIALMHSELSEALEEYRMGAANLYMQDGKPEGFGVELADCVIRIFDMCGRYGIDLEACLRAKIAYNATRPHRHGGKKA